MKDYVDESMRIVTLIAEVLTNMKPTDPLPDLFEKSTPPLRSTPWNV